MTAPFLSPWTGLPLYVPPRRASRCPPTPPHVQDARIAKAEAKRERRRLARLLEWNDARAVGFGPSTCSRCHRDATCITVFYDRIRMCEECTPPDTWARVRELDALLGGDWSGVDE